MSAKRGRQVELLAGVDLFYGCFRRELLRIAALTTETKASAGDVLCKQGEPGLEAFVIIEGAARVSIDGREVALVEAGGFFGELAILDGGPRIATVTAIDDMRLLVLTRREFRELLADVPYVAGHMLTSLGARLRRVETALYAADRPPASLTCG